MFFDGAPIPPGAEFPLISPFEAWCNLFLAFWLGFFMLLLVLPRPWSDALFETAFPFLPRREDRRER